MTTAPCKEISLPGLNNISQWWFRKAAKQLKLRNTILKAKFSSKTNIHQKLSDTKLLVGCGGKSQSWMATLCHLKSLGREILKRLAQIALKNLLGDQCEDSLTIKKKIYKKTTLIFIHNIFHFFKKASSGEITIWSWQFGVPWKEA